MKALVTGADGFVGGHLRAHLAAAGDDVTGVDRADGPDLLDGPGWLDLLAEVRPDAVYHLGGWSDVGASWSDPMACLRVNAEGTLNVLAACLPLDHPPRVLVVTSADLYGTVTADELPLTEASPIRPVTPYAASKAAADQIALQHALGHGLPTLRVRAFNHLGPGQTNRFLAPALAERIARAERFGEREIPVGNLTPRRDLTDVRDVVRAYRLLIEHGTPGEAYNVCTGRDLAVGDVADRLVALAGGDLRLVPDPALARPVDVPVLRGDPTKLTRATGWAPTIDLDQTLADVLAEWRVRVATDPPPAP